MTAAEAKKLSDIEAAKGHIRHLVSRIEEAAKRGVYECTVGPLDTREMNSLKLLGYQVEGAGGTNCLICWGTV